MGSFFYFIVLGSLLWFVVWYYLKFTEGELTESKVEKDFSDIPIEVRAEFARAIRLIDEVISSKGLSYGDQVFLRRMKTHHLPELLSALGESSDESKKVVLDTLQEVSEKIRDMNSTEKGLEKQVEFIRRLVRQKV